MRLNKLFILYSLFGILMASCIKDEAPNAEADILTCNLQGNMLDREAIINNDNIILSLKMKQISMNLLRNLHLQPVPRLNRPAVRYATLLLRSSTL